MNKIRTRRQIDFWHENGCLRVIPAPRRWGALPMSDTEPKAYR